MRAMKNKRLHGGAQFALLVGLALGMFGFAAPAQAQITVPATPRIVSLTSGTSGQLGIGWRSDGDGGSAITGYEVQWKLTSAADGDYSSDNVAIDTTTNPARPTATITMLADGPTYNIRVRAVNAVGNSGWRDFPPTGTGVAPETIPEPSGPPTLVPGDESLTASWQEITGLDGRTFNGYTLRWKLASAPDYAAQGDSINQPDSTIITSPETTSYTITGLTNGQAYDVQLRFEILSANIGGGLLRSDWVTAQGTPVAVSDAPASLRLTPGDEEIGVSWSAPADDGGSEITGYELQWKLASAAAYGGSDFDILNPTDRSYTIQRLSNDMVYDVRVRAGNAQGNSAWASAQGSTFSAPSTPRAPSLSSGSSGTLNVRWSAPADGGSAITAYEVEYKLASAPATAFGSANLEQSGLSATITELEEGEEYDVRVRATNRIGMSAWSAVATGSPSSAQRNARTTSRALSQTGNAVAAGAIDVLGGQLGAATGGAASGGAGGAGGNQSNFTIAGMNLTPDTKARTALPVRTHADEAAPRHSFELSDLLQLGTFRLSLFHKKDGDKAKKRTAGAPSNWAIWGRGNVRGFASETDAGLELDGNAYAGWLGVDYTHSRSLMGGLAVSYDESRTDYTDPEFGGGEVSTRLGSFYPYLRISPTEALDLWGLMGFGWGSLDFSGEGQEDASTDMTIQVYALGAQLKLIDLYGAQFSLKSDASFAVLKTASQANLPGIRTEPSRMRFALATQYPWEIDAVSKITPSVELGGRLDFNEVSGGAGMELGGAVNYNHSTLRLNAEARARGLVYHNDSNVQDWGVSFQLRVDPNQFGQGLFASFAPHWGQSQSRVQRLWRDLDAPQGLAQDMSLQPHQMEAEFGYGFALPRMKATLSPFGRTRFAQSGAQTFSLGSRLQLGDMKLELTGEQQTAPTAPTDHRFSLHLSMPLGK